MFSRGQLLLLVFCSLVSAPTHSTGTDTGESPETVTVSVENLLRLRTLLQLQNDELSSLKVNFERQSDLLVSYEHALIERDNALQSLKKQLDEANSQVANLRVALAERPVSDLLTLSELLAQRTAELESLRQASERQSELLQNYQQELSTTESSISIYETQLTQADLQLNDLRDSLQKANESLARSSRMSRLNNVIAVGAAIVVAGGGYLLGRTAP